MPLNSRSKEMIAEGAQHIRQVVVARGSLGWDSARHELRQNTRYQVVRDRTLEHIGDYGVRNNWFMYANEDGFWAVGSGPARHITDLVQRWGDETIDGPRVRNDAVRRVVGTLRDTFEDPTVDRNAVEMAQYLNERLPLSSQELGSFRSFVVWGIENGLLVGDMDMMVPPADIRETGLRRGTVRARIVANSMTNTRGQWLWDVISPDGMSQEWHTIREMSQRITELLEGSFDDDDDIQDVLDELRADENVDPLEAAIQHALFVAEDHGEGPCADEHRQLASWLMELQALREAVGRAADLVGDR